MYNTKKLMNKIENRLMGFHYVLKTVPFVVFIGYSLHGRKSLLRNSRSYKTKKCE